MDQMILDQAVYRLKWYYHFLKTGIWEGERALRANGNPAKKLRIIAITGTDGKTTSSTLLYRTLQAANKKVALISTVAAYIGDQQIDTGFHVTTPEPAQMQQLLKKMVDEGVDYVVLEATSQGIYQSRLWGVRPLMVGYTNITPEHLDYHLTYDNYLEAKATLGLKAQEAVVINEDDEMSVGKLRRMFKVTRAKILTYSMSEKLPAVVEKAVKRRFPQPFNWQNCRLVYTLAHQIGVTDEQVAAAIDNFTGIPGRMETVATYKGAEIVVDFAHTANGLIEALTTLKQRVAKQEKPGELVVIFGCAGLRDRNKRPLMGKAAAEIADIAIFTAEDPRTESVETIFRQMKSTLAPFHAKVLTIADRREAIVFALKNFAHRGTVIAILGKGHEQSMAFGQLEYPWNDHKAVRDIVKEL